MKTTKTILGVVIALSCSSAFATDCGCKKPTAYDKTQDLKIGALQDRDAQLAADIHQVHMNVLGKYSESWGLEDRANIAKLQDQKLDKSVFTADQQRQDKAITAADTKAGAAYQIAQTAGGMAAGVQQNLNAAVSKQQERDAGQDEHINAVQGAAQSANEKADGLAVRAGGIERQAGVLDGRVGAVEVRSDKLEEGQRVQDRQMESDRQQRVDGDRMLSGRIDKADAVNSQQDKAISSNTQRITTSDGDIKQLYANGEYAQSRIDAANANIEANRSALVASNKRIAANSRQLADHEQRLDNLQQQTNRGFAEMGKRIDKVEKRANAGAATAMAASGIPQVTGEQRFSLGAALGGYESEQAVAVGFSSRITSNVVLKASAATDSQHGVGYNVGTSIGW